MERLPGLFVLKPGPSAPRPVSQGLALAHPHPGRVVRTMCDACICAGACQQPACINQAPGVRASVSP